MINKDKNKKDSHLRDEEITALFKSLVHTIVLVMISFFTLVIVSVAWFASNTRTNSNLSPISAISGSNFALATLGSKPQGIYDDLLSLFRIIDTVSIDSVDYYVATGNSSIRLDSDKNINNYYGNQDLRPGNKGNFDIYVICNSDESEFVLEPCIKAYSENENDNTLNPMSDVNTNFLYGHILFFTEIDNKGMYSNAIDMSKQIKVNLEACEAVQSSEVSNGGNRTFTWGKKVGDEDGRKVYKLSVYWVWPEHFGNFIYTGNSYNKNIFSSKDSDYTYVVSMMQGVNTYYRFFNVEANEKRPSIDAITNKDTPYQTATEYYNLYSSWYDKADEWIGENISYIELGFELLDIKVEDEGV